jgi:hypothetical protein
MEDGLIDQASNALHERSECLWIRAALHADVVRTADRCLEEAQEDAAEGYRRLLDGNPRAAVVGLKRRALGCRWLIVRWEYPQEKLAGRSGPGAWTSGG